MRSNRLAGHELRNEGKVYDVGGWPVLIGSGRCTCGERSPVLPTPAARKRWHREHKDTVRAGDPS
jgi:hypothetical protein